MKTLEKQIGGNIDLIIYEDGQVSDWLYQDNVQVFSSYVNHGVAFARNILLEYTNIYDYIMFLDSDDMIDCDFISKMYDAADKGIYDMLISRFIYQGKQVFYPKRCNVAGICLRKEFIKGLEFDEDYNISEDTIFINQVYDRNPKIFEIDSNYHYNYGANPNSLMMRYERNAVRSRK